MKSLFVFLFGVTIALQISLAVGADADSTLPQDKRAAVPSYKPPVRGAPSRRIGGASRGVDQALPQLYAIAPDHTGLTVSDHPVLYWFISKPTKVQIEITVIDEAGEKPLLEMPVSYVEGPAVHALDLSKHGVKLKAGIEYQWTVALVPDAAQRSGDVISGGAIRVVEPSAELRGRVASATAEGRGSVYASQGIWYDAIHALSSAISARPKDAALRAQRAALAEQVGLNEVAAYDRRP